MWIFGRMTRLTHFSQPGIPKLARSIHSLHLQKSLFCFSFLLLPFLGNPRSRHIMTSLVFVAFPPNTSFGIDVQKGVSVKALDAALTRWRADETWHAKYMNVACQIHESGAPDTWIWRANYFIFYLQPLQPLQPCSLSCTWRAKYMNVAHHIHKCGAPDTWMWRTRYMNVARQIHECGVPDTWMWRARYVNLACQLFYFTCSPCNLCSLSAFHVLGEPITWIWGTRYMNVARQTHECDAPDTWIWRANYFIFYLQPFQQFIY